MSFKLVYLNTITGELGKLPDFGIANLGGTSGTTFTVGGKPLLFADGASTDGSPSSLSFTLQGAYNNSAAPAIINLTSGRDLIFNALNSKVFQFDASTGKVTITGDLAVLGSSSIIEGVISQVDQISIQAPNGGTSSLLIEPMPGVTMLTDLVKIQSQYGGLPVFLIDGTGHTSVKALNVGSINFTTFHNAFTSHIGSGSNKHFANQIVVTPLTNLIGNDVQTVLASIDAIITGVGTGSGSGNGSVVSVAVTSDDMAVTGSPITSSGTISLALNTIPIEKGGTGAVTAVAAINALVPPQSGHGGKFLSTNGSEVSWVPAGAINSSSGAGLFFIDAIPTSTGNVGSKLYVPGTAPANKVIYQATTDTSNVSVTVFAEGDSAFYSPTITITTDPAQLEGPIIATITEDPADKRSYYGVAQLTRINADTTVTATSSTGAVNTLFIQRATAGPVVGSLVIGPLPGTQTEVKSGDALTVTGTIQNTATYAELISGGVLNVSVPLVIGPIDSGGPGYRTLYASISVGTRTGAQSIQAHGRTALGTFGALRTSTNSVVLNQTYPVIGASVITYPIGQQAVKDTESATVTTTITEFNTVLYTAVNLSVLDPSVYSTAKIVTRTGGSYSYGTTNVTITANKASNNATSTGAIAVNIAHTAPQGAITIAGSPVRLLSSVLGVDYTVIITANQRLMSAPSMLASSGTWLGSWVGAGSTWSRVLRITDTDQKGIQSFSGLSMTGLSGITGSAISAGGTYNVGGFAARTITFAPFERFHTIGTSIVDFSKVSASYTGSASLARRSNTDNAFQSFTIVDSSGIFAPFGDHLFISDLAFSGANTSGTLQLTIAEAA